MRVPVSWLREFVEVPADAAAVAARLGDCGFAVDGIDGDVIDFDVTANRPDCLSIYGLAREAAAAFDRPLAPPPGSAGPPASSDQGRVPVSIGDPGCGRYALALADVTVGASPGWLASRLLSAGVRPINNVVDVTNYVMLEMGHPMHAFDVATLAGPEIHIRRARPGETITTLDGQARTLDDTTLAIADQATAVAIAGVMGGAASEVTNTTTRIALESAWFHPALVRAASRRLGLKTEASARFERGADLDAPVRAIARALTLLVGIGAGRPVGTIVDVQPAAIAPRQVPLDPERLARLLGESVPDAEVERILSALGFGLTRQGTGWQVLVPSFRLDVTREADLIEEVGRHWGFDRVRPTFPALRIAPAPSAPGVTRARTVRRLLTGAGLQEAVTFTFTDESSARPFAPGGSLVAIANPLSEKFAVLRPSLVPGLLASLAYSRRRESADIRLFETGSAFSPAAETVRVGWVLSGSRGEHWSGSAGRVGFTDARGVAELLARAFGVSLDWSAEADLSWCTPGRRAEVRAGAAVVGWVGELSSVVTSAHGLPPGEAVVGGELALDVLAAAGEPAIRRIEPLPRFPSIVRDLSILVDERLPAADVRGTIRAHAPQTLVSVREFDRYQGRGVPEGRVSLSLRLTFRDADRTLTDDEAQQAVERIVRALETTHGAVLRSGNER